MSLTSTALSLAIQESLTKIGNVDELDKRNILAIAIGRCLAIQVNLPSTEVYDIGQHYHAAVEQTVMTLAGAVNELYVIDTDMVCSAAKMYYCFRYNMTYDPACFASFLDRCMTWSDNVMPEAFRECASKIGGNQALLESVAQVLHLVQHAETPIVFKKELLV